MTEAEEVALILVRAVFDRAKIAHPTCGHPTGFGQTCCVDPECKVRGIAPDAKGHVEVVFGG